MMKRQYEQVKNYIEANSSSKPYRKINSSEGEEVFLFNPALEKFITSQLDKKLVAELTQLLAPHLEIKLGKQGLPSAANRDVKDGEDSTNYDAVWVRDAVWVYYALKINSKEKARNLILKLLDYFLTDEQMNRLDQIIDKPYLAKDSMLVPHVRFDGSNEKFGEVYLNDVPEVWNHKQMDAYGLFIIAVCDAIKSNIVTDKYISSDHVSLMHKFAFFFASIRFWEFEDSGAWEEIDRVNTSSIGLVTRALQMLKATSVFSLDINFLDNIVAKGFDVVVKQLEMGGESPAYSRSDVRYREADFALAFLLAPSPLEGLSTESWRRVLGLVDSLKRPRGYIRYERDSYQAGNYWIKALGVNDPTLTGNASDVDAFENRLSSSIPDSEAEWFFDSIISLIRVRLYQETKDAGDLAKATIHLKRALGQITGSNLVTADGVGVAEFLTPESINTILINNERFYLPSPITPLNWAKATLVMALSELHKVL